MHRRKTRFIWFYPEDMGQEDLGPDLLPYAKQQYNRAWDKYVKAGCPFGKSDLAMLLWFTFDQQTREN